jgi:hypothetical protein
MFPDLRSFNGWNTRRVGQAAGWQVPARELVVVGGVRYLAHRIIWLIAYGEPVPDLIDHADGNPHNNRLDNLRAAARSGNGANAVLSRRSTTGSKGVTVRGNRFRAIIGVDRKIVNLGTFDTIEEAAKAYRDAAVRYHGEFARWGSGPTGARRRGGI